MAIELMHEKWPGVVSTVTIGATAGEGGTRSSTVNIGGQKTLPLLTGDGQIPNRPVVAFEVWDIEPQDWHKELLSVWGDVLRDPVAWAEKCVKDYRAELICLRLQGANPDFGDRKPEEEAALVKKILAKVGVPLVVLGSGDDAKDNLVLPAVSEAAKGERILIGDAVQDNYKTLAAACLADGHNLIAESPIDINIAKQLNILVSDMGLPLERIVINPTIGALGYGLEYAYSIMERARLAALAGDKTVASPFICFVGQEAWKAKEAKAGPEEGIFWEMVTATALIQAGADIMVMRHPKSIEKVKTYISKLF